MQAAIYQRIIRPVLTEKSHDLMDRGNKVVFEVQPDANKIEVRKAIEAIYNVKVDKINVVRCRGKIKRIGKCIGKRKNWKKVFATLKEGYSINFFPEV